MARPENDGSVRFLYGTVLGRGLLKTIQALHMDRLAVWFLRSGLSRPYMAQFAKKNQIPISKEELKAFPTYRDFFLREREPHPVDTDPGHLISPCDGWLSAYGIQPDSSFAIKNSLYRVKDLLGDDALAKNYEGGTCLVFRLCASDYHHYCYIDDGRQGPNHYIEGLLHSVQPIACEHYPIFDGPLRPRGANGDRRPGGGRHRQPARGPHGPWTGEGILRPLRVHHRAAHGAGADRASAGAGGTHGHGAGSAGGAGPVGRHSYLQIRR